MEQEHGAALSVMQTIKEMFDPNNILNPGKVLG
jgi:FAD/FMN-containing dehydrogenase